MAEPIRLESPTRDVRAELAARLDAAPSDHAEALLEAYELLQALHEQGLLDIVRGAVSAKDEILTAGVEAANAPGVIRGIRNGIVLLQLLGRIDPDVLKRLTDAAPAAIEAGAASAGTSPGMVALLRGFAGEDSRRGLAALQAMLAAFGNALRAGGEAQP